MADPLDTCARELLDVMPLVMQDLRRTMRSQSAPDLRVPELRSLAFLRCNPGSNLTDLAEYIGVSLPSMSKLVDTLTARGFIVRTPDAQDRRRVRLDLTETGLGILAKAREAVKASFAAKLAKLAPQDVERVTASMNLLHALFAITPETGPASG
ncbi:MarR family winged helix-turn-helix transcriptional regulator [Desulfovibrio sp. TomC]|uniref:MarR family winged helix-turn-helix transcriptional regulator n=1 Tax=Desulfovibrio sp. TomC TaxID=1562888 RepID=UPI000575A5DE|nr:MarR family transcriptional regulator [Desulfovibrio sp. TomC]KHK04323.1 Transcriptional regulator, MarR family [Desulfovibrio sp. TomC]